MSCRRVFLADVSSTATAPTPLQRLLLHQDGHGVGLLQRVHVQGLCVWRDGAGAQPLRIEIDDGTSVALLQVRGEAVAAELQEVAPGNMVRAMGDVQDAPLFAVGRSWKQWIDATSVCVVEDPNAESLFLLETLLLHKSVHLKSTPAVRTSDVEPTTIPLLALPRKDASPDEVTQSPMVGAKRKLLAADARPPPPSPSPLKPSLLEMNATQQQHQQHQQHQQPQPRHHPFNALAAATTSTVPPAEYQFHVSGADLKHIGSGAKTLEIRLNYPPYSIIRANDRLKFNGKIDTTVQAVRKYAQLRTALEMETLSSLLPPATAGAREVSVNGAVRLLRQFISEAEETRHGVAVFEFLVPATARTPAEWAKLIYEFLAQKGGAGCTLRDLQFAFPVLAVATIDAMLNDLQLDAVVHLSNGTYRLI